MVTAVTVTIPRASEKNNKVASYKLPLCGLRNGWKEKLYTLWPVKPRLLDTSNLKRVDEWKATSGLGDSTCFNHGI